MSKRVVGGCWWSHELLSASRIQVKDSFRWVDIRWVLYKLRISASDILMVLRGASYEALMGFPSATWKRDLGMLDRVVKLLCPLQSFIWIHVHGAYQRHRKYLEAHGT